MKTQLLVVALFVLTAGVVAGHSGHSKVSILPLPDPGQQPGKARIDAVFVLDTTGSMGGLIQAAKENIWSIASEMAAAQPTPELRIGLVAYRDRSDAYVTQLIDLSTDLDSMYAQLMNFQAEGGGDFPEAVNEGLDAAVHRMSWSQAPDAYKVVFLVGDAPPQMNYPDDVKYPVTLKAARDRGIVINTIQAGEHAETRRYWQQIASLGRGASFQVGMQGDAIAVSTPFDEQIARLSKELDRTRMFYGDAARKEVLARKTAAAESLHASAPAAAIARRAEFNASSAGKANFLAGADLVADIDAGRIELDAIADEKLPATLAAMTLEERRQAVAETAARRTKLEAEIGELAAQRREHIAEALRNRKDVENSLDHQILKVIKEQAAAKGLRYEPAPSDADGEN
jgi:Mg-chelatase subunit ChlD